MSHESTPLQLFGHPFSSYTQKALIALWETDTIFEFRHLEEGDNGATWAGLWPMSKMPVLVDGQRTVVETSIIIEYLQIAHPGTAALIPANPMTALDVRFMDRVFDLHVMDAMQIAVDSQLGKVPLDPSEGLRLARERLERIYGWLDRRLEGLTWATGEAFTMADCAAAPFLFYADWVHEIDQTHTNLRAYRARLLARPTVARAVEGGRPYRDYFPLGAPDRD